MNSGELIKALRTGAGLTKVELAKRIGRTPRTIYYWECGKVCPNVDYLVKVMQATGYEMLIRRKKEQ